jgi:hypothetical protein
MAHLEYVRRRTLIQNRRTSTETGSLSSPDIPVASSVTKRPSEKETGAENPNCKMG